MLFHLWFFLQLRLRQLQSWRHNTFHSLTFRAVGTFFSSLCQITHLTEANPCQLVLLMDNRIRRLVISATWWPIWARWWTMKMIAVFVFQLVQGILFPSARLPMTVIRPCILYNQLNHRCPQTTPHLNLRTTPLTWGYRVQLWLHQLRPVTKPKPLGYTLVKCAATVDTVLQWCRKYKYCCCLLMRHIYLLFAIAKLLCALEFVCFSLF